MYGIQILEINRQSAIDIGCTLEGSMAATFDRELASSLADLLDSSRNLVRVVGTETAYGQGVGLLQRPVKLLLGIDSIVEVIDSAWELCTQRRALPCRQRSRAMEISGI